MPTIYFDACCLNRPFDDQSQDRIRLEAEAVLLILSHIQAGEWQWIGSDVLNLEIEQIPDLEKRARVTLLASNVQRTVTNEPSIEKRGRELRILGFGTFDAQHLANAESGGAEIFLTTDDQLLHLAACRRDLIALNEHTAYSMTFHLTTAYGVGVIRNLSSPTDC